MSGNYGYNRETNRLVEVVDEVCDLLCVGEVVAAREEFAALVLVLVEATTLPQVLAKACLGRYFTIAWVVVVKLPGL